MGKHKVQLKQLAGALNLDDPVEVVGSGFHRAANGIVFQGTPPNRRASVINGNSEVVNSLLPAGVNKTICQMYDGVKNRVFFLNYNSLGSHGIYMFDTIASVFYRLVQVGVNASSGALVFNSESHANIDIIYGDSTLGDILLFIDGAGVPKKINIARALSSGYGQIISSYLDVAKQPSPIPPYVVYEDDPTNTVNKLRKKLFRFKVRWVFDDQDKSVTSSQSEMALPWNTFNQATDSNPAANCRLAIVYQTGPANVKKIEILGSLSLGNVMSDFFLIESIDKSVSGIADNDIATFLFYNNKAYDNINVQESNQLQDYVPIVAESLAVLNGNVISYGCITEGYSNLTNFSFGGQTSGVSASQVPSYYGNTFSKLVASQSGDSGFGNGSIHITVRGLIVSLDFSLDTYAVYMTDGSNIQYTLSAGDDAASIIEGLRVDALGKGYTVVSVGNNDLVVQKASISLARTFITSNYSYVGLFNSSLSSYDWLGAHAWGLVYFDAKGRTNGVVTTTGFSVDSVSYAESGGFAQKPSFNASIYHSPPVWAAYYQWVRTKDLKKSSYQQWISDRTFKDTIVAAGVIKYAYIGIESLNVFVNQNPGTPLGYSFSSGDRITFFKRFNGDGTTATLYGNSKDFEIASSVVNPTINGQVRTGQYIKIVLPSTDGSFDFGEGFSNYFIEMYTPAQSVANGLNVYYEYGERYAIGNSGASDRFHQGMNQNQVPNTTTPATFYFMKGDFYIKLRSVETGNDFLYTIPDATINNAQVILMGISFISKTYDDVNVTNQSVSYVGQPVFDPWTDSRWHIRAIEITTFRVRGTIVLNFLNQSVGSTWNVYLQNRHGEKMYLVSTFDASNTAVYSFAVDVTVTLEDDRLFLLAQGSSHRDIAFVSTNITYTISRMLSQQMVDENFSDYFPSAVNSNGRAFVNDPNSAQVRFQNMYRWSLAYQENTSINQTSRFYPENFDETNRSYGAIRKMSQLGSSLIFFLERKIGHTGVFQKFITDNSGNNQLVTTNSIITQNNVQYYAEDIGVGNQPTSVVKSVNVFYGVDPVMNIIWRLSGGVVTDLSETYKVKAWASQNIPKYLNPGDYAFGGKQKVLGTFNVRPDNIGEYLLMAQGSVSVAGETFAFEEKYNSFYGNLPIDCDCLFCAENVLYMFQNGKLWKQSNSPTKNNFFEVQYEPRIMLVFNEDMPIKKLFMGISYQSNQVWASNTGGDVETDTINSQTNLKQQSRIMYQDYDILDKPSMYAAFNRDTNSMSDQDVALWEGDYLCGRYITVMLRFSFTGEGFLLAPYITWVPDPRNF